MVSTIDGGHYRAVFYAVRWGSTDGHSCSKIIRTARARTSPSHRYCVSTAGQWVEYLFALLLFSIGSIFAYLGASGKQGAVQFTPRLLPLANDLFDHHF